MNQTPIESTAENSLVASIAVVMPAAGRGQRFGSERNKVFAELAGQPVWLHTAQRLARRPEVFRIIMPISESDRGEFEDRFAAELQLLSIECVTGGAERTDSVMAGLKAVAGDSRVKMVAIHDAARPLVRDHDLQAVFQTAHHTGAAILATPVTGTVKRCVGSESQSITVDRSELWIALTPQVFHAEVLYHAYARHRGRPATDDAQIVERTGHPVALVRGSADNIKITLPEDLLVAEAILKNARINSQLNPPS